MAFMSDKVRGIFRLIAADFVVLSGIENGGDTPLTFLWSGSEKHLTYFQKRIFGLNAVTLKRIGRRPITMLNSLLSKFDCSFGATILQRDVVPVFERPGDFSLPLWVDCDVDLSAERTYAKSESMRGDLRKIRNNQLTWKVSGKRDDFEFFFEKIYLPTVTSSHGRAALLASQHKRLQQIESGTMELIQVMRDDQFIAGVTIDYRDDVPGLRDSGVLDGSPDIKKLAAITATYLFAMDYLASKGYSKVGFGRSRSFLDDGVLNFKRKFRPVIIGGSDDSLLLRIRHLDDSTRSMLCSSPCVSWQSGKLHRTYFRDESHEHPGQRERQNRGGWRFGLDAESVFDVSGESILPLT